MTNLKYNASTPDMKRELRQLRQTARKIASTKESARRFLMSTGIYSASGRIRSQFR